MKMLGGPGYGALRGALRNATSLSVNALSAARSFEQLGRVALFMAREIKEQCSSIGHYSNSSFASEARERVHWARGRP